MKWIPLTALMLGCQPDLPGRACEAASDCFAHEICVSSSCVERPDIHYTPSDDAALDAALTDAAAPDAQLTDAQSDAQPTDAQALDANGERLADAR